MVSQQDFERKLQESKEKYIKQLPEKISEIKILWNHLFSKEWNQEMLLKLQRSVNNLAGSGSTFGFPKLSEKALMLYNILKNINTEKPNVIDKVNINDLVEDLQNVELNIFKDIFESSQISKIKLPELPKKSKIIYILDADNQFANELSVQISYYHNEVVIINDLHSLEKKLQSGVSPSVVLIDSEFALHTLYNQPLVQTLQEKYFLSCPFIFISSNNDLKTRLAAVKACGEAYFTKPVDIGLLLERINTLTNTSQESPYRILIVEEDEALAKYYAIFLERVGMKVNIIDNPEKLLDTISRVQPELIVLGMYMSQYNGLDLARVIRQHQSYLALPIVLLSAEKDTHIQYFARQVGVDDFLIAPIPGQLFSESILNRVQRSRSIRENLSRDGLTGLFTYAKIKEHLEAQLSICKRFNRTLSLVVLDLDNFKSINERYGYTTGDQILINFSNLLKRSIRTSDFIGRVGGEKFVMVLPETNEQGALTVLDRIRRTFASMPQNAEDKFFNVSFSAGVAVFPAQDNMEKLFETAERALSGAKLKGKNCIEVL